MVDEINAAGGVLDGKKLELVTLMPELDVERSLEALQQAIEQEIPSSPSVPARTLPLP